MKRGVEVKRTLSGLRRYWAGLPEHAAEDTAHLELVLLDDAAGLQVLPYLMEDGQHGDVGLPGAGGSADEQVFVGVVGRLEDDGLDPVEPLHPSEHQLCDLPRGEEGRRMNP